MEQKITYTTKIKNEMSTNNTSYIESLTELSAFISFNASITDESIILYIENASVARRMYKLIKETYLIQIKLTIRQQKKFSKITIYILEIREKIPEIVYNINNMTLDEEDEKMAYLRGTFLATGSLNDPKTNRYHVEFSIKDKKNTIKVCKILNGFNFNAKIIKREKGYMVYMKSSEEISELIKMFGAFNAFFYYEDIRIYKDHLNTVNRLNNIEQATVDKIMKTADQQISSIEYLIENNLYTLLDDKTKIICEYRKKYRESSYQELANIISIETNYKITKSGINHHFRKVNELIKRHQSN